MKILSFAALSIGLCLLAGCASDPMKPDRPSGQRVPVNLTPPPVTYPVTPAERLEAVEAQQGESRHE